jgi:hypothetical protein
MEPPSKRKTDGLQEKCALGAKAPTRGRTKRAEPRSPPGARPAAAGSIRVACD